MQTSFSNGAIGFTLADCQIYHMMPETLFLQLQYTML